MSSMQVLAYIDAGTGSIIIQAAIGLVVGVGVLVKAYWSKIRQLFGKSKTTDEDLRKTKSKEDA